jgi:hypothetical protein
LVLVTLASGQFLMTLDSSVMNVAIARGLPARVRPGDGGGGDRVAVGPLIGGIATTYFSWRNVFVEEVLDGLRTALAALALLALLGLFFSTRIPTEQPGSAETPRPENAPGRRRSSDA